ncbi:hypothetical protein HPP92_023184 [Vanilla planifolia]|uniref:Glycosyltransferase n=1 Tax=Vanilla planifolia TaxID=51239 RepID=A0A835PUZ6_VANPL|nr:hypothetical protein HPP92_023184 [Vanilla planifolia]
MPINHTIEPAADGDLHIVMFPFVAFGHISPFLQLSRKLTSAGMLVTFLTTPASLPRISSLLPFCPFIRVLPIALPSVPGLPPGAETTSDLPLATAELLKISVDRMQPQIASLLTDLRPHLIFFDFAHPWLPSIAHPLGIKSLFFSVFSAASTAYLTVPSRFRTSAVTDIVLPPAGFPSSTSLSTGVPHYQAADFSYVFKAPDCLSTSVYDRVLAGLTGCSAIVAKSCLEMEGPYIRYIETQIRKPMLLAGPLVPEPPSGELAHEWTEFLDLFGDDSVVFCSFGSETFLKEEGVRELLLGLEMTEKPFLAVLNGPFGEATAAGEGFVERVKGRGEVRQGWVPQQLILRHRSVGCFLSHAGMSSLVEGVVAGCRLVMMPIKGDQFMNARLFAGDLGIGVEVEREEKDGSFGRNAVKDAVMRAMAGEEEMDKEARERLDKWRGFFMDGKIQGRFTEEFVAKLRELARS